MNTTSLLRPTLHVEVLFDRKIALDVIQRVSINVEKALRDHYASLAVGTEVIGYDAIVTNVKQEVECSSLIQSVSVVDYTGPNCFAEHHKLVEVDLDVQTYYFKTDLDQDLRRCRRISLRKVEQAEALQARILPLPNIGLKDEWNSLVFDDALPSQLLRYLTRMLRVMKQPGLNLSTFNWNRLCLLHGPPGSGKSTLCRALAQKLSIRLVQVFPNAVLVDINTNSMLSKYFGESGKVINAMFEKVHTLAQSMTTLVCVVMDEVETIAGSRTMAAAGGECNDGLRATNQLLTALDHVRCLPNIIVICTSNLIDAVDSAFLDRVDIKRMIPSPSQAAIYNIFRSCLNELVRSSLVDGTVSAVSGKSGVGALQTSTNVSQPLPDSEVLKSVEDRSFPLTPAIPTLAEVKVCYRDQPQSLGMRIWTLSEKCEGFSGRTLRRLPILSLAMFTWGGNNSIEDAVTSLESAVDQELTANQ